MTQNSVYIQLQICLSTGVVYLQYKGETKAANLPPELTSLDTIRALFVQSYQGLLTMPVLDKQLHAIMLKNTKNGKFEEIENVKWVYYA